MCRNIWLSKFSMFFEGIFNLNLPFPKNINQCFSQFALCGSTDCNLEPGGPSDCLPHEVPSEALQRASRSPRDGSSQSLRNQTGLPSYSTSTAELDSRHHCFFPLCTPVLPAWSLINGTGPRQRRVIGGGSQCFFFLCFYFPDSGK